MFSNLAISFARELRRRPDLDSIFLMGFNKTIEQRKYYIFILEWEVSFNEAEHCFFFLLLHQCISAKIKGLMLFLHPDPWCTACFDSHDLHFVIVPLIFLFQLEKSWHFVYQRASLLSFKLSRYWTEIFLETLLAYFCEDWTTNLCIVSKYTHKITKSNVHMPWA